MSVARYAQQPATPQTPATPSAPPEPPYTPNGSWRHPAFDTITKRKYATTFDERNVRAIVVNAGFLILSLYSNTATSKVKLLQWASTGINAIVKFIPYNNWAIVAIRLVFVLNILYALAPLYRRFHPDEIADIPLTPSQRASMGLKMGVHAPQTPGSAYASPNYVTPPRYQRSTPRSNSFSNQAEYNSQSPVNGSPRASMGRSTSNSPFSPNNAGSPLFQRALGASTSQRLNYGSPMSNSLFGDSSSSAIPGTPTPSTGKASVGLNNKWLYEKRRDSPKSSLFM